MSCDSELLFIYFNEREVHKQPKQSAFRGWQMLLGLMNPLN